MRKIFNKALVFLAAGFMLGACEKNAIPEITESVTEGAMIKFYFHVEGAPRTNFFLGNNKVTAVAPNANGDVLGNLYGAVYPSNAYAVVPAGNFNMSAIDTVRAGGSADLLATSQVSLQKGKNYSAFLVGTKDNYETFIIEDKLPKADHVSIWWRFVNTMANMPFKVDAYAVRAAVPAREDKPEEPAEVISLGSDLGFKEHGDYVMLRPGSYTYKVYPAGTTYDPLTTKPYIQNTVVLASLGRVYTTQIKGTYAAVPKTTNIGFWRER